MRLDHGKNPPLPAGSKPPDSPLTEDQKETILVQLRKKNLALEHLEGYIGLELAKFKVANLNDALTWISRQKPGV